MFGGLYAMLRKDILDLWLNRKLPVFFYKLNAIIYDSTNIIYGILILILLQKQE